MSASWSRNGSLFFEGVKDELGDSAAEAARQKAAREVLKWAETVSIPIRPGVTEPFVARGSLHMLADEVRLGWHPEFHDRLAALLQAKEGPPSVNGPAGPPRSARFLTRVSAVACSGKLLSATAAPAMRRCHSTFPFSCCRRFFVARLEVATEAVENIPCSLA